MLTKRLSSSQVLAAFLLMTTLDVLSHPLILLRCLLFPYLLFLVCGSLRLFMSIENLSSSVSSVFSSLATGAKRMTEVATSSVKEYLKK